MDFLKSMIKAVLACVSFVALTNNVFADNIIVNGVTRNMIVYAPSGIERNRPLIIQMHGMNQDAPYQQNAAKWEEIADTARFVVVFPNGENKAWDISGDKDVNFLKAIINEMSDKYGIDTKRVYVSGFSMGGMMSYHAANKMGDMIAAIAPVSGYPIGNPAPASVRPMPIIHTHGTTDDVVNYESGANYLKRWVSFNKCSENSQLIKPYPANRSGSAASLETWSNCSENIEVRLLSIAGKGHWYSMDLASVNTSDEIWNFVKNFSLDGSSISPPIQVPTNRDSIFNGNFDSTAVAWELQLHGDAKANGSVKDGKYVLDISAIGTENYQVQLIQHDIHLEKDKWYEVSFDASASSSRSLEVNVEQHNDPWDSYLSELQIFELNSTTQNFSFKFQMKVPTDTNSRLSFNAGAATGTLFLDNIKIRELSNSEISKEELSPIKNKISLNQAHKETFHVFNLNGNFLGTISTNQYDMPNAIKNSVKTSGTYLLKSKTNKIFKLNVK